MGNSKKNKLVVYLAELSHDQFGLSLRTTPLGLGAVTSYALLKLGTEYEVKVFRTFQSLIEAIDTCTPDIIGFGYFAWNDYLTLVAVRAVREKCPEALIVFGGSNISPYGQQISGFPIDVPDNSLVQPSAIESTTFISDSFAWPVYGDYQLITSYPEIDVIIHGDAEIPLVGIMERFLETGDRSGVKAAAVQGCSALVDGTLVRGPKPEILMDLDQIPSPYITGVFSDLIEKYNLIPQIETMRGCPYKCTFCTIGSNESLVRKHSLDYSIEEILYLKDHVAHNTLRIADPNWGMLKKDIELAEFIESLNKEHNYPVSLRVYYSAGGPFSNIKKMALMMKNLLPLNMSFQSLNKGTLKHIKRGNMPLRKVEEMVSFAKDNQIATGTELISGLPLESFQSFKESFLKAVKLQIDSVFMGPLYLIKGSELWTNAMREKNKFKTRFALVERNASKISGRWVFDTDEVVVAHTHMSEEDFFELFKFRLWGQVSYAAGYLKEIIMHCLNYDISPLELYDELLYDHESYSFINRLMNEYIENVRPLFFDSLNELENKLASHIEEFGNVDLFCYRRHLQIMEATICSSKPSPSKSTNTMSRGDV